MGLTPSRLLEYFSVDELRLLLSIVNESQAGTRLELIERILIEWPTHNKKWEKLLGYLDRSALSTICEDYDIDHHGTRDVLERRLRKEIKKSFPKNPSAPKEDKKEIRSTTTLTPRLKLTLVCWSIFGMSMGALELGGFLDQVHEQPIPVSKEYFAMFPTSETQTPSGITSSGSVGNKILKGNIIMKGNLFSANNPIDVSIDLHPDTELDPDNSKLIDVLPEPFFVFFLNADNHNMNTIFKEMALINLTKHSDPPRLSGKGTIIYSQGGTHEIYVVDPRESKLGDIIQGKMSHDASLAYTSPKEIRNSTLFVHGDGSMTTERPQMSESLSENMPYYMTIKEADALISLESDRKTGFAMWLAITFTPVGIVLAILSLKK